MAGRLQGQMSPATLPQRPADVSRVSAIGSRRHSVRVQAAASTGSFSYLLKNTFWKEPVRDASFSKKVMADEAKYILQTYARVPIVISHGKGSKMWDVEGKEYIDLAAGIAVNALGHSDQRWYASLIDQARRLSHTSNLYHTEAQVGLAKRLVELSFADKVFFCNSGTEANEAAIKFARKHARVRAGIDPYDKNATAATEIVSFANCFHGRTMGTLALTYKDQYRTPFLPLMPGNVMVPYNDLAAAKAVIVKGKTCAVFVEPVQGEGGIYVPSLEFMQGLREACTEAGALLVFDEVQCGLGRTGKLWAYEQFGVTPDVMTLAKPLAGGLPVGAVLMTQAVADIMAPGDHGSTFAGNPLVCAAACTVFDIVSDPVFLKNIEAKGERLRAGLKRTMGGNKHVKDVRGVGLLCGVQLDIQAGPITVAAREMGVLVITAGKGDVLRFVPPLVITDAEIDTACEIMGRALASVAP